MATIQRRVYEAPDKTSLIFTEVVKERGRGGVTLSILTDKMAHAKRLPPDFGAALESVIKAVVKGRAA